MSTKKTEYASLIGSYSDEKNLRDEVLNLRNLGFSSYVVKSADGSLRLLVGAFATERGAVSQQLDLETRGVKNQVIKR